MAFVAAPIATALGASAATAATIGTAATFAATVGGGLYAARQISKAKRIPTPTISRAPIDTKPEITEAAEREARRLRARRGRGSTIITSQRGVTTPLQETQKFKTTLG